MNPLWQYCYVVLLLLLHFTKLNLEFCCILNFISSGRNEDIFVIIYRDAEPSYHNAGDYSVPYGGVPAHHNTWQHPDVQQMQNAQQDARQQQRYDMDSLFRFQDCFQKNKIKRKANVYVVVNFLSQLIFIFPLFQFH